MKISEYRKGLIVQRRTYLIKGSNRITTKGVTLSTTLETIGNAAYSMVLWDDRKTPERVAIGVLF